MVGSLALRAGRSSCPHCLGDAEALTGEASGLTFRLVRCRSCGDAVVEPARCALCDAPADRYAVSRPLLAVYACSGGCVPFALDAVSEEAIRRADFAAARGALRARMREDGRHATHPVLITGRIVEDYRTSLEVDPGELDGPALR